MAKRFFFLFFLFFFVASAGLASATVTQDDLLDGLVIYYNLDETTGTATDNAEGTAGYDGTANNARVFTSNTGTSGIINSGADFTQGDDSIGTTGKFTNFIHNSNIYTISYWINAPNVVGQKGLIGSSGRQLEKGFIMDLLDDNIRMIIVYGGTGFTFSHTSNVDLVANTWYHVVATGDGTTSRIYIDGQISTTATYVRTATGDATQVLEVGRVLGTGYIYSNNFQDEVAIWNRALNSSEVTALYDIQKDGFASGSYDFQALKPINNFSITAQDVYDNASLTNFSALIGGTTYTTTNGTITTDLLANSTSLFNISVSSEEEGGYFTVHYNNYNVSTDLLADLFQARINATDSFSGADLQNVTVYYDDSQYSTNNFTVRTNFNDSGGGGMYTFIVGSQDYFNETVTDYNVSTPLSVSLDQAGANFLAYSKVSGEAVNDFNITIDGTTRSGNETFPISSGDYNATFSKSGWYNLTIPITIEPLTNHDFNFTDVYNHKANFTVNVGFGSATEQNFTLDIYSDQHVFQEKISTTNGEIIANLIHGNYTVWINDSIHTLQSYKVTLNDSTNFTSIELEATSTNTVSVTFYDEITREIIADRTITAFFTGSIVSYNRTTTNGTLLLDMINPQPYIVTYDAANYTQRRYSFELINRSFEELSLYLLEEEKADIVLVNVKDTLLNPVEAANVRVQRKNLAGTDYYTVETCDTDNLGECLLRLELFDTTYRFQVLVNNNLVFTSVDQDIKGTTITFIVSIIEDAFNEIVEGFQVTGSITFNEATNTFSYNYVHLGGTDVTSCLETTLRNRGVTTTVDTTCAEGSSSGVITSEVDMNVTGEYTARGYIINSPQNTLASLSISTAFTFGSQVGLMGLFLFGFFIVGVVAFTGLANPAIPPVMIVGTIWLLAYVQFVSIGIAVVASLAVAAAIVVFITRN